MATTGSAQLRRPDSNQQPGQRTKQSANYLRVHFLPWVEIELTVLICLRRSLLARLERGGGAETTPVTRYKTVAIHKHTKFEHPY